MTQQTKTYLIAAVGIAVIAGLLWWGNQEKNNDNLNAVRVGVILPISGGASYYGSQATLGIETALEVVKENYSDFEIELYYEDSMYTPKGGIDAYRNLKHTHNVNAVITLASPVSLAVKSLANQDDVLQLAIATTADSFANNDDLSFRTIPSIAVQAAKLGEYVNDKNFQRIGIIYLNNDFGVSASNEFKNELKNMGIDERIVVEEGFMLEDTDFRSHLAKIKVANPDAIYLTGTAAHYNRILQQARETGLDVQFFSISSTEDPVLLQAPPELVEGIVYSYYDIDTGNLEARNFVERYSEKNNIIPDGYAAEGYEAIRLIAHAFKECAGNAWCAKSALHDLRNYDSVFGLLQFNQNGDVSYPFTLKTVEDGEFVRFE